MDGRREIGVQEMVSLKEETSHPNSSNRIIERLTVMSHFSLKPEIPLDSPSLIDLREQPSPLTREASEEIIRVPKSQEMIEEVRKKIKKVLKELPTEFTRTADRWGEYIAKDSYEEPFTNFYFEYKLADDDAYKKKYENNNVVQEFRQLLKEHNDLIEKFKSEQEEQQLSEQVPSPRLR